MSMKNRVLLQRSGRDQFGNKGDSELIQYEPNEEQKIIDSKHVEEHKKLNDLFVKAHNNEWLKLFEGFNKKETWKKLCPYGKPSLSAFYAAVREHDTMIQFLTYWLVANKHKAMQLMNLAEDEIKSELSKFNECGRYYVTYGSGRMFGTKSI
ncbi:hypothetical protein [Saccharophagus degradans]|uniref:Uncharacterized protein n=1 Tax=Saccharophagus degradans TaxID=86304 RepID=A0AAW7X4Q7_9GAMM|nr:hypothetical protein [Saccharophagus degradans]MDO6421542.1 hypothetical protein [Saccharophagus degradans]MDO6608644.1 hypothetical protein [Saccharophagus degradans]